MDAIRARWPACKSDLQERVGAQDVEAWANRLSLREIAPGHAILAGIPNSFFKNRILIRFGAVLREVLSEHFPESGRAEDIRLGLLVGDPKQIPENLSAALRSQKPSSGPASESGPGSAMDAMGSSRDDRQRFSTFVEGDCNRMALNAAREVAADPGRRFNPLVLVGGVGTGKSHLMSAIAQGMNPRGKESGEDGEDPAKIIHMTAEAFANEVLDAIRARRMKPVRERLRGADLLMLDDLEFLLVSVKTQEELLHTFDALLKLGKQMVFSADRFPAAMQGMNPTLRSRLETALAVELSPMGPETRLALVHRRAERDGLALGEGVAELLAERITGGARQLEGALVRLMAYASLESSEIDEAFVLRVADPFFDVAPDTTNGLLSGGDVLGALRQEFGITERTLRSRNRTTKVARMRKLAVYFLRHKAGMSFPEIGALLGNRTHSTVIHALRSAEEESQHQGLLQEMIRRMDRLFALERRV